MPQLLTWRRASLRELWKRQDRPDDLPAGGRPIIDPDLVGPDDFRAPVASNPAFALWLRRREWVDAELRQLATYTRPAPTGAATTAVPDIEKMLDSMYDTRAYILGLIPGARGPFANATVAWPSSTPKQALASLQQGLTSGELSKEQVRQAVEKLADELGLTVDAFSRLMALRSKASAWLADPRNPVVEADEWREVYSILADARKRLLFEDWRKEEDDAKLEFGPNEFWISIRPPAEGDWPPTVDGSTPLIDPELLKLADLPDPAVVEAWTYRRPTPTSQVRDRALALFLERQSELEEVRRELRKTREDPAKGLAATLLSAFGTPLPVDLDQALVGLNSSDATVARSAEGEVRSKLFLPAEAFRRMMAIRAKENQADASRKPTAAEYEELYGILTTARKQRVSYKDWKLEEDDQSTGVAYWSALKARLPRWRTSTEARAEWQRALRLRMRPPIVDPDLIGPLHISAPFSSAPAWLLWVTRSGQV